MVTNAQGRGQQAANAAKKPVKAAQQTSIFQGLAQAQGQLNDSNVSWTTFLGLALLAGVTFGSVIQVSHNNPNLPVSRTPQTYSASIKVNLVSNWQAVTCSDGKSLNDAQLFMHPASLFHHSWWLYHLSTSVLKCKALLWKQHRGHKQGLLLQVYDFFTCNIDVFKGQILAYDPQKFDIGIAKESGLVPLLLAPIWLLFPYLQVG